MNAFVVIEYDLEKLKSDIVSLSKVESVICVGLYEFDETELASLQRADTIYFVVSETSMCSSAYQMLLFATFPLVNSEKCYLLKLDNINIPAGFPMLQELPIGRPA